MLAVFIAFCIGLFVGIILENLDSGKTENRKCLYWVCCPKFRNDE